MLQLWVCRVMPLQSCPLFLGGGTEQERFLSLTPPPHGASHSDHAVHSDHWPSTTGDTRLRNRGWERHLGPVSHSGIKTEVPQCCWATSRNFPGVIACINGWHIPIKYLSTIDAEDYRNPNIFFQKCTRCVNSRYAAFQHCCTLERFNAQTLMLKITTHMLPWLRQRMTEND